MEGKFIDQKALGPQGRGIQDKEEKCKPLSGLGGLVGWAQGQIILTTPTSLSHTGQVCLTSFVQFVKKGIRKQPRTPPQTKITTAESQVHAPTW